MLNIYESALNAQQNINAYIRKTPLDSSSALSKITNANIYLKCENLQYTAAFKVRGAFSKLLSLDKAAMDKGIVTASSGNHGAATAFALHTLNQKGLVFVPENASTTKIKNIEQYNIPVKQHGTDCLDTENFAKQYAAENNMTYVSPYNDPAIIAGQGTIGLELLDQLDHIDTILVPVGGGGLISGIAGVIKAKSPNTQIIGCLPKNSPVMAASIEAGNIIEMESLPTLSDATAGGIEPGAITFELCQQYVDEFILVSETEIKQGITTILETQHQLIEGSAGVAVAALLQQSARFAGKNVVVILCGANISLDMLKTVIS